MNSGMSFFKISALFFLIITLQLTELSGQTDKGSMLLGGSVSFQSQDGRSVFNFNPNLGIFLADNFAVGMNATFFSTKGYRVWGLGPSGRVYFGNNPKGKFYTNAGISLLGVSSDFSGSDTQFGWNVGAGYAIFLNPSTAIEIGPSYSKQSDEDGWFSVRVGFQIHLASSGN